MKKLNKTQSSIIICAAAAIIGVGATCLTYFVTKPTNNNQDNPIEDEKIFNKTATALFSSEGIKDEEVYTDFEDTKRIQYGSKLTLNDDSNAFYYELRNVGADYDFVDFAIGIQNNVVIKYKYLGLIDGHGVGEAEIDGNAEIFIGYSLGGEDVLGGVTVMDTYNTMKKAIDKALEDAQRR